jgi:hypothetical protein
MAETFARRRATRYRRNMRIGFVLLVVLVGCKPMYGDKPEKMRDPRVTAAGSGSAEPPPTKQYDPKCTTTPNLVAPAKGAPRDIAAAQTFVQTGDAAATKAADAANTVDQKRDLVLDAINQYIRALQKDPYDADATVKLAILYDRTLRKGCAIYMLKRLETLAQHRAFEVQARNMKEYVYANSHLFADYRDEALREIP